MFINDYFLIPNIISIAALLNKNSYIKIGIQKKLMYYAFHNIKYELKINENDRINNSIYIYVLITFVQIAKPNKEGLKDQIRLCIYKLINILFVLRCIQDDFCFVCVVNVTYV